MTRVIGGAAGVGIAVFAGTTAMEDNTERNDRGEIVESGGLGAFTMQIGDCFNDPDSTQVASVEGVPCTIAHDNEVFAEFELTDAGYPGRDSVSEDAWLRCHGLFTAYVGIAYEDSVFGISTLTPTAESWEQGDREVTCFLFDYEGATLTRSAQGSRL